MELVTFTLPNDAAIAQSIFYSAHAGQLDELWEGTAEKSARTPGKTQTAYK
ncbi:MAG: hypothetical protein V6Z82_05915 [Flavobacteriales bacterium]